jgi:hypothetical protein
MNDETLIANLKEVGEHFFRLEAEAKKRGYEVRFQSHWSGLDGDYRPSTVEVLKKV